MKDKDAPPSVLSFGKYVRKAPPESEKPDSTLALRFGEDTVNIKGTNLERLRFASANTGRGSFRKERTRSKRQSRKRRRISSGSRLWRG
jgi:hypothetical protein